jgi:hypothetical protein
MQAKSHCKIKLISSSKTSICKQKYQIDFASIFFPFFLEKSLDFLIAPNLIELWISFCLFTEQKV